MPFAYIPPPPTNGVHLGPLFVHFYGLMYVVGIALAVYIGRRRWRAAGGDPALVDEIALWGVPAGIIGGRLYFDVTTPKYIPHVWYGFLAVWDGGLGIWGGVALATVVGVWRVKRSRAAVLPFMDAVAPAILCAQAIGRIGNYFNQELFGGPSSLPWALKVDDQFRPAGYLDQATFHPTFLYELIWDLALAAFLVWLGHRTRRAPAAADASALASAASRRPLVRPGSLFALYVAGYSAFRMFEESLRVDPSEHFLGLRLNFYVAAVLTVLALLWFAHLQRRPTPPSPATDAATPAPTEPASEAPTPSETPEPDTAEPAGPESPTPDQPDTTRPARSRR